MGADLNEDGPIPWWPFCISLSSNQPQTLREAETSSHYCFSFGNTCTGYKLTIALHHLRQCNQSQNAVQVSQGIVLSDLDKLQAHLSLCKENRQNDYEWKCFTAIWVEKSERTIISRPEAFAWWP